MEIHTHPALMAEIPLELQYWIEPPGNDFRVRGILTHRCNVVSYETLRNTPGLEGLSIFAGVGHCNQGTNFRITQAEGNIIMGLIP